MEQVDTCEESAVVVPQRRRSSLTDVSRFASLSFPHREWHILVCNVAPVSDRIEHVCVVCLEMYVRNDRPLVLCTVVNSGTILLSQDPFLHTCVLVHLRSMGSRLSRCASA